ncbi:unnamed protein product [Candidula unifasciata]|uniref:Uncharacterized protein n=1 Tax=Candidula unifasciata TaxID=100452 RepID=A0A8S3YR75_9EUPU|nr:unnamed protein product [Candidula unifasciata]
MFIYLFAGLIETMRQTNSASWSQNPDQFGDLASSLNNYFNQAALSQSHRGGSDGFLASSNNSISPAGESVQGENQVTNIVFNPHFLHSDELDDDFEWDKLL